MHLLGEKPPTINMVLNSLFTPDLILLATAWSGDNQVSWLSSIPFACVLLLIALGPMFFHPFWESDKNKGIALSLLSLPVVIYLYSIREVTNFQSLYALQHSLVDYLCFMSLIGSLYVVSSGIVLTFKWKSTPLLNSTFLSCGALLANFLGTTGASILLFKPYIHANRNRNHKVHLVLFFIFIVGNMGGLLTPLGDPPLFLGYLNGIDFFWTISLWPQWLVANTYLLITFLLIDFYYWRKDYVTFTSNQNTDDEVFHFLGKRNFIFLGMLLFLVLLQSPSIGKPLGTLAGTILPVKNLTLPIVPAALAQLFVAALVFATTPNSIRETNAFSWQPIREVAILFIGIFITMIPALEILRQHSSKLALDHPWQYFWLTGGLSSILDNAPTFLAFTTLAAGDDGIASLSFSKPVVLAAICCGAVFMGANTYIGNGPNFLIKAMAENNQIKMPSFFTYAFLAFILFLPLYLILSFVFF